MAAPDRLEFFETTTASFTHADIVAITSVTATDLQNWVNRDLMKPVIVAPGRQGKRVYSFANLACLYVATRMMRLGVSASIALQSAPTIVSQVFETRSHHMERAPSDLGISHYFTAVRADEESERAYRFTTFADDSIPIDDLLRSPAVLINTGELIVEIANRAFDHLHPTKAAA